MFRFHVPGLDLILINSERTPSPGHASRVAERRHLRCSKRASEYVACSKLSDSREDEYSNETAKIRRVGPGEKVGSGEKKGSPWRFSRSFSHLLFLIFRSLKQANKYATLTSRLSRTARHALQCPYFPVLTESPQKLRLASFCACLSVSYLNSFSL